MVTAVLPPWAPSVEATLNIIKYLLLLFLIELFTYKYSSIALNCTHAQTWSLVSPFTFLAKGESVAWQPSATYQGSAPTSLSPKCLCVPYLPDKLCGHCACVWPHRSCHILGKMMEAQGGKKLSDFGWHSVWPLYGKWYAEYCVGRHGVT